MTIDTSTRPTNASAAMDLQDLAARIAGQVSLPGSERYLELATPWNALQQQVCWR